MTKLRETDNFLYIENKDLTTTICDKSTGRQHTEVEKRKIIDQKNYIKHLTDDLFEEYGLFMTEL